MPDSAELAVRHVQDALKRMSLDCIMYIEGAKAVEYNIPTEQEEIDALKALVQRRVDEIVEQSDTIKILALHFLDTI